MAHNQPPTVAEFAPHAFEINSGPLKPVQGRISNTAARYPVLTEGWAAAGDLARRFPALPPDGVLCLTKGLSISSN